MLWKHFLYSGLSLLGIATIIGSGFCFWAFYPEEGITTGDMKVAIDVTQSAQLGDVFFGYSNTEYPQHMILDEGSFGEMNLFDGLNFYRKQEIKLDETVNETATVIENNDDLHVLYKQPSLDEFNPTEYGLKLELGMSIQLVDLPLDTMVSDGVNNFEKYISVVDAFTNNTVEIDGKKYFPFNTASNSILNSMSIFNKTDTQNAPNDILYVFNLSRMFKYTSFDLKPTSAEKFHKLRTAMYKRSWKVEIDVICRYVRTTTAKRGN